MSVKLNIIPNCIINANIIPNGPKISPLQKIIKPLPLQGRSVRNKYIPKLIRREYMIFFLKIILLNIDINAKNNYKPVIFILVNYNRESL